MTLQVLPRCLPATLAFVDVEVAAGRIIEIAVLRLEVGRPPWWFGSLVDPGPACRIGGWDARPHGIHPEHLVGAPAFANIASTVQHLFDGAVLVAHNAPYDRRALQREFCTLGLSWDCHELGTLGLARQLLPARGGDGYGWSDLARALGVRPQGRPHRAETDVVMTLQILVAMLVRSHVPHLADLISARVRAPERIAKTPDSQIRSARRAADSIRHPASEKFDSRKSRAKGHNDASLPRTVSYGLDGRMAPQRPCHHGCGEAPGCTRATSG